MSKPKDSLGDRMKAQYEHRTRYCLPRSTYTVIRLDGKAFHTYTRGVQRPYCPQLMADMDATAIALMSEVQGAKLAYVQSDEISIVMTDFDTIMTDAWFDGNIQKIVSVSASIATEAFNRLRPGKSAHFDSRVFTIPDSIEVENYLIWRQQDATRNSIQMAGQSMFSAKELHGVNCNQIQEKLWDEKQVNWNDYPAEFKRGRCIVKEWYHAQPQPVDGAVALRSRWVSEAPPIFTQEREYLRLRITPEASK